MPTDPLWIVRATLAEPYPVDIFTELTDQELLDCIEALTACPTRYASERLHASWARHLYTVAEHNYRVHGDADNCMDCGRELVPQTIPGAWRCGACIEAAKGKPMRPAGTRPPEPEEEPEPVSGEVLEPHDGPPGRAVEKQPAPATPVAAPLVRAEPSWRELGHWLGLAEADDGSPACRQAGAAFRLFVLREMGLPWHAVPEVTMLRGKLYLSAALLRYLAERAGYRIKRVDDSDESCTAVVVQMRTGREIGRATFTIADAKRAGLIRGGSSWTTYPARMLWHRASAFAIRDFLPEVGLGLGSEDERQEIYAGDPEPIGEDHYIRDPPYVPMPDESESDEDIPF